MPVLHQHVGRHHGPPVVAGHYRRIVAGSELHRSGLAAAAHQAIDDGELADLLQRLRLFVAHATSSGGCRPVN